MVLMVTVRLSFVVMVWQVWLGEGRGWGEGWGRGQGGGGLKKNGAGYCKRFAIFNS